MALNRTDTGSPDESSQERAVPRFPPAMLLTVRLIPVRTRPTPKPYINKTGTAASGVETVSSIRPRATVMKPITMLLKG